MILGIGVDIVHVRRIRHWLSVPGLVERFFHESEVAAASARGAQASLSLAARFAAKEAFGKALGSGLSGVRLRDILVVNDRYGKPGIEPYGTALEKYRSLGGVSIHVSLTHESDNAVAFVVIEGDRP